MPILPALLLALAAPAAADPPAASHAAAGDMALSDHMAPLGWLVGEWHGSGWMMMPSGQRQTFNSREIVTSRLSGNALLVEGRHTASDDPARVVHDALAMLTWDANAHAYRFRSALANGQGDDFPVEVQPGGYSWRMDLPSGRIDYVIRNEGGAWVERGTMRTPDGQAHPFFEMRLTKQ